jgi:hypothetical protein
MFKVPEHYRMTDHWVLGTVEKDGRNGAFQFKSPLSNRKIYVIASDGEGWEHVSVHVLSLSEQIKTPTWEEMCFVKDLFWDEEDVVMQLHPKKSEYVNMHPNTLHLWRPVDKEIPTPEQHLV